MERANNFYEIQSAVDFNTSIFSNSPFFTDFEGLRGNFREEKLFKLLNIKSNTMEYMEKNSLNKKVIFIAGHRGSGKTTELNNFASKIKNPKCFYPIMCYLDKKGGLDINNIDFVDILIYMLENLAETLKNDGIEINEKIINSFYDWYSQRIEEINKINKEELKIESSIEGGVSIPGIFKLFSKLTASLSGTDEVKTSIRRTFTNKFSEFALKFNQFIEEITMELREKGKAKDIIFIIDGFEKIGTLDTRRKILISDSNKLLEIKANMILTLPIELMNEAARIQNYGTIINFPVVKLLERDGREVESAIEKLEEFICKRIDKSLFTENSIKSIIMLSGGSPRELLRIIEQAYIEAENEFIDNKAVEAAVKVIASTVAPYLTKKELEKLKELKEALEDKKEITYDEVLQGLLEKRIIFEYNDGTYKRVNPIIEKSKVYIENV